MAFLPLLDPSCDNMPQAGQDVSIPTTAGPRINLQATPYLPVLNTTHDNIAPYHQRNTWSSSIRSRTNPNRFRTSLCDLPAEIRLKIYSYFVETEQENLRVFTGRDNPDNETETCLPIKIVRPPALIRTSRLLRKEYLPYFFEHTIFRIDARCDYLAIHYTDPDTGKKQHAFDKPAAAWLASLHRRNGEAEHIRLRNLIYLPILRDNIPLGFRLGIVLDTRKQVYKVDMHITGGWTAVENIIFHGGVQALKMPDLVGWALETLCKSARGEVLNLELMAELERLFGRHYALKNPVAHARMAVHSGHTEVVNAVEGMLREISCNNMDRGITDGTNRCHSKVIPLTKSSESGVDFNHKYFTVEGDSAWELFCRAYPKGEKYNDGIEAWKSNARMRQIMRWNKADELDKVDLLSWSNEGWYTFHWF